MINFLTLCMLCAGIYSSITAANALNKIAKILESRAENVA